MAQLPPYEETDSAGLETKIASGEDGHAFDDIGSIHSGEDILGMQDMDPALNKKMHLVNNVSREYCLSRDSMTLMSYSTLARETGSLQCHQAREEREKMSDPCNRQLTRSDGPTTTLSCSSSTDLVTVSTP